MMSFEKSRKLHTLSDEKFGLENDVEYNPIKSSNLI